MRDHIHKFIDKLIDDGTIRNMNLVACLISIVFGIFSTPFFFIAVPFNAAGAVSSSMRMKMRKVESNDTSSDA